VPEVENHPRFEVRNSGDLILHFTGDVESHCHAPKVAGMPTTARMEKRLVESNHATSRGGNGQRTHFAGNSPYQLSRAAKVACPFFRTARLSDGTPEHSQKLMMGLDPGNPHLEQRGFSGGRAARPPAGGNSGPKLHELRTPYHR
jgi:hypothetical protein